jgi:recombination protein RecR
VLHLLRQKEKQMRPLAQVLSRALESVRHCHVCGNLDAVDPCHICADPRRDRSVISVVEEVADLWAIERCHLYKGLYHVLGGTLGAALKARLPF